MWTMYLCALLGPVAVYYFTKVRKVRLSHPFLTALGLAVIGGGIGWAAAWIIGFNVDLDWRLRQNMKLASVTTEEGLRGNRWYVQEETYYKYYWKEGRSSRPERVYMSGNVIWFTPEDDRDWAELEIYQDMPHPFIENFVFTDGGWWYNFRIPAKDMPKGIEVT